MNKEKRQSWIKKLYTSPNHRIFSISATVILFIMIFMGCICYELLQNREAVIQAYEDDQEDYLQLLAYNIQSVQKSGKDTEVLAFLQEKTVSAGERFFVYTRGSEVLWAVETMIPITIFPFTFNFARTAISIIPMIVTTGGITA